ncbi:hypothetical protein ABB37_07171 [Leptomonas pyrrhocoris]|uniref:Uncharacterized protein n=1 Tax=Leptomonas pyrrhocoris TaxID=157538 RepID=A0A0M9FWB4_LEPPY|nr:hypothetical protein ABB37_07171 [Leptomonas pyrrhocoris]XP_015655717.1 hypothetical protein ABB37_07171 [Leptomonas pyrrhocoris]KPA77277.1 hypothetical protein ABB37_07171 [Leptomonas pyrrhocoris]KPA77278.1 hypothetical protein ABB37_07171 [Leptomonas pyrrhocoris]|eukprot:XP_015655716.1 hypothetical protein ABB37_07171 [Leptomonas pyrrhocoris]
MGGPKADVTAFQLAAELASRASTSASADGTPTHTNRCTSSSSINNKNEDSSAVPAKRRGPLSQVDRLLDDQRRLALRDGTPYDDSGHLNTQARPSVTPTTMTNTFALAQQQRMPQEMYGHATSFSSSVHGGSAAALQEALRRWGLVENGQAVGAFGSPTGADARPGGAGGPSASSPSSSPQLRHTWRLMEMERRQRPGSSHSSAALPTATSTATTTSSTATDAWSLGQRWTRSDDLVRAKALQNALRGELTQRQKSVVDGHSTAAGSSGDSFYARGLQLCAEGSAWSPVSLPVYFATAPPSLLFFSFTEEEYSALTQPPPLRPSSAFTFTYALSCYLFELWSRFGNPVVVVDRWAWDATCEEQQRQQQRSTTSCVVSRGMIQSGGAAAVADDERREPSVPSVEQVCAEYARVTAGVLQQRQQRLLNAVLKQQQQQQQLDQQPQHQGSGVRVSATATAAVAAAAACAVDDVAVNRHTPFVASFDRYALLHSVRDEPKGEAKDSARVGSPATQQQQLLSLTSQPSPPPNDPYTASSSTAAIGAVRAEGSAIPTSSVSPLPALRDLSAGLPPQQRLIQCATPHPWYLHTAEVQRRTELQKLLRSEQATNVPYQKAVTTYLALAASAAQVLQRASYLFDDRDRAEVMAGEARGAHPRSKGSATQGKSEDDGDDGRIGDAPPPSDAPPAFSTVEEGFVPPPREAFTVHLQPLPNVDPAAWKAAEAALRKAAVEVLGTAALRLPSGAGQHRPHLSRRGKRSRSSAPRQASKRAKRHNEESARAATAITAKRQHDGAAVKREAKDVDSGGDGDDGDGGRLARGSSESSVSSNNGTDDSEGDEEADEEEDTLSGGSDQDDDDDEAAATHPSQEHSALSEDLVAEDEDDEDDDDVRAVDEASEQTQQQQRQRRGRGKKVKRSPKGSLSSGPTYRALQAYLTDVIPFRCTRMRLAAQAGWLLPTPPPLPHSLTNPLSEREVVVVDVHAALHQSPYTPREAQPSDGAAADDADGDGADKRSVQSTEHSNASRKAAAVFSNSSTASVACAEATRSPNKHEESLYQPILTEEDYQQLRKMSTSAVCNRVVSHTGEAVLLSLPPAFPKVHREVEQELERYLYDDTSAMMEVNATAQSLLAEIRVAYTQNTHLQRYTARVEHVVESLKKVEQEGREAGRTAGAGAG